MGQVFILMLAFILAFFPHLYIFAIFGYIALMIVVQMLVQSRASRSEREEVLRSRIIYREDKLEEIIASDESLVEEYSRIVKTTTLPSLLSIPVIILLFWLLPGVYHDIVTKQFGLEEHMARFVTWLLVFESTFAASMIARLTAMRVYGRPTMLMIARGFEVRERGLVLKSGLRDTIIPFPLDTERYELHIDENRRFVELRDRKSGVRIRLYTTKPRRVYELITRLGLRPSSQESP
ncbi:uncharacterized conserved protein UCP014484, transmembrane [Pyrolobus fumarii 1A]|uniref:Uncharacterized conserved protein UCP014484, transmembrane n=1 Tax=Pyrolobus fumarii (strain DSM 11204 / 1A) TaxID=694429 RepID=G0EDU1_PYRF1|nr:uncharacterized conserved protein UCP014484, transmembrane [Pyrolobus fumarii 1A]